MIKISRDRPDANGQPIRPPLSWFGRSLVARHDAVNWAGPGDYGIKEAIYRDQAVQAALLDLFYDKCSYCEWPLARVDWDVDHYRPKGRVREVPGHPGYYWLAYDWSNLLPACVRCNRPRRGLPDRDGTRARETAGKADQFPLAGGSIRAHTSRDNLALEKPLLLNPTIHNPEEHITFDPKSGAPIPKTDEGEESIRIYNLDSSELNRQRVLVIDKTARTVRALRKAARIGSSGTLLQELSDLLNKLVEDRSFLAATARAVVADPEIFLADAEDK